MLLYIAPLSSSKYKPDFSEFHNPVPDGQAVSPPIYWGGGDPLRSCEYDDEPYGQVYSPQKADTNEKEIIQ